MWPGIWKSYQFWGPGLSPEFQNVKTVWNEYENHMKVRNPCMPTFISYCVHMLFGPVGLGIPDPKIWKLFSYLVQLVLVHGKCILDWVCLVTLAQVILSSLLSGRAAKDNILSLLAHLKLLCPDEPKEASQGTSRLLNHRPQDGLRVLLRPQLPVTVDKCLTKMNDWPCVLVAVWSWAAREGCSAFSGAMNTLPLVIFGIA